MWKKHKLLQLLSKTEEGNWLKLFMEYYKCYASYGFTSIIITFVLLNYLFRIEELID